MPLCRPLPFALLAVALLCGAALGQMPDTDPLYRLADGPTKMVVAHGTGRGMAPCRARAFAVMT